MIRSRLRRPTSKSMTAVFFPALARPQAMLALVVVLPTPPLPEVTTMISAKLFLLDAAMGSSQRFNAQAVVFEPDLHGFADQVLWNLFKYFVRAGDCDSLRIEALA